MKKKNKDMEINRQVPHNQWTATELNILKEDYPTKRNIDISKKVNHSIGSIGIKARKIGLKKDKLLFDYPNKGKRFSIEHKRKIGLSKLNEKNPQWKGKSVGLNSLHLYLKSHHKKPERCVNCGKKTDKLDLANISGKYKRDINDFEWLCRSCHMKKDGRINNLKQYKNEN